MNGKTQMSYFFPPIFCLTAVRHRPPFHLSLPTAV